MITFALITAFFTGFCMGGSICLLIAVSTEPDLTDRDANKAERDYLDRQ